MRQLYRSAVALAAAAAVGAAGARPAVGQDSTAMRQVKDTTIVTDRVVAVVGNHPILLSQVEEEMFTRQSQPGFVAPANEMAYDSLRRSIVDDIVDDELLVQEAERDTTIKVTAEEVLQAVDQQVKGVRARFTSEVDYVNELKKAGFETPDEYRRWSADNVRRTFYKNRLLAHLKDRGRLKPVIPTDKEMRAFFARSKGQLDKRPATISFRQIVIAPKATPAARARARALADSIVLELRNGADFATAARRFSADSATRVNGGDLGWERRGRFLPEFERVEYALKPGAISDPVETAFGFHIIQVLRTQPTETNARHILITPAVTASDVDSARALALRLSKAVSAGASFDSLQRLYHDASEEKEAPAVPLDKLPEVYAKAIGDAPAGTIVPPFELGSEGVRQKFAIVKITERRPEGDVSYEDMKDRIRTALSDELSQRRLVERLREFTYVDVREP